jgi:hypothetical protein
LGAGFHLTGPLGWETGRRPDWPEVMQIKTDIESGKLVLFTGPLVDQDGKVRIEKGAVLTDDAMGSLGWFVKGVVGSPK